MNRRIENYIGNTFERLTVKRLEYRRSGLNPKVPYAYCVCLCGTEKWICLSSLRSGCTKSCGCKERERIAAYPRKPKLKLWRPSVGDSVPCRKCAAPFV